MVYSSEILTANMGAGIIRATLLCGLLFVAASARAQNDAQLDSAAVSQVQAIQDQVTEQSRILTSLREDEQKFAKAVDEAQRAVREANQQIAKLDGELRAVAAERKSVEDRAQALSAEQKEVERLARARVRAMYKQISQPAGIDQVILRRGLGQVSDSGVYFARIRRSDETLMTRLSDLAKSQQQQGVELLRLEGEQRAALSEKSERKAQLERKLAEQKALVAERTRKRKAIEESLTQLRAQALRIETVLRSVVTDSNSNSSSSAQKSQRQVVESYDGPGLSKQKLLPPVRGRVAQAFGGSGGTTFDEIVSRKGVVIKTATVQSVQAVAPGRVAHVGEMPGYGMVVIIDHGSHDYTVMGRLAGVAVKPGDGVERGDKIAETAAIESGAGALYFEVRRMGSAVNPKSIFPKGFS